jgi:pimeloyl-ACP methyl ester carboxylesterase
VLGGSWGSTLALAYAQGHPDAQNMVEWRSHTTKHDDAWHRFISNKALLRRHAITRPELEVLKRVSMLNPVAHPEHFVFILNAIRLAAAD